MKNLIISLVLVFIINNVEAQLKVLSNGNVGAITVSPKEAFQIGDRWTFHNGGSKIIGYNTYYDASVGYGKRLVSDEVSLLVFDQSGNVYFRLAGYGSAGSRVYDKNALSIMQGSWNYNILMDYSAGQPTIRPSSGNCGYLGTSSYYWYKMYTRYIYRYSEQGFLKSASVNNIENPIGKLQQVNGYYKSNNSSLKSSSNEKPSMNYGLYGNEIKELFPELVDYNDSLGIYGIDYDGFIPILIEAFKEQQNTIEELKLKMEEIQTTSNITSGFSENAENTLYQNSPNPFSENTSIRYLVSSNVKNAMIIIYDMQGVQKKSYKITQVGNGEITINSSEFIAGMYMYSLIVNNKLIDTKRMVLTE